MNKLVIPLTVVNFILLIVILAQGREHTNRTVPDVLQVRKLQLVDSSGEVRAQLNVEETSSTVVFRMMDSDGTIRVKLGADEQGSGLVLLNDLTELGVHILADDTGSTLTLRQPDGTEQTIKP